jgi:hypothetical protein
VKPLPGSKEMQSDTEDLEVGEVDGWNQLKHVRNVIAMVTGLGCFNDNMNFSPPMSLTTAEVLRFSL